MRALKFLGLAIGGLVALLVLLLVAVWLFVDPNAYKDRIAQAVKASTGRELTLAGDIRLAVFPQLTFTLGHASLGNPPGFGAEPFAVVDHVALRVRLLPLLRRQLEVGRIEIDGLDLRLVRNAAGKGNWEAVEAAKAEGARPDDAKTGGEEGLKSLDLAGILITNSQIHFGDFAADSLRLEFGATTLDFAAKHYRLSGLSLAGRLLPKSAPAPVAWKFATPLLDLDLAAQTFAQTSFQAQLAGAQLSGSLSGSRLLDAPSVSAQFDLRPLALREWLTQLGVKPPGTRDPAVLAKFAAQGALAYEEGVAHATKLAVQLDDSQLQGSVAFDTASGLKTFDLTLDRIDVDRYLPPPTVAATAGAPQPVELPSEGLRDLQVRGTVAIGALAVDGLRLTTLRVGIDAKGGVAQLKPVKAQLYGGQYTGEVSLDTRPAAPRLTLTQTMADIDVAAVLQDFVKSKRLSGRGTVTTALNAEGRNGDALLKSLRGTLQMKLANGAVEGVDLTYAIAQAQSLLQKRQLAEATNTKRTTFDTFSASADIVNGIATTKDLAIASPVLRVSGQGSANLVTQAIDYRLTTTLLKAPPQAGDSVESLTLAAIPVNVTGSFDNPRVRPDLEGLAKARVKQELDKHKDELKQKIQDKLKGLFGR